MWMNYEGYGMGWHWLGWLSMAFFWLIPILLVLAAVKYLKGDRRSNTPDGERKPDALAIPQAGNREAGQRLAGPLPGALQRPAAPFGTALPP